MARPNSIRGNVARITGNIDALIRNIMDGCTVTFVRIGEKPVLESLIDFWAGRQEEFPIGIKIKVRE